MRIALFLSPHLDDAIFSCGGRILAAASAGMRVVIATLFSHARRGASETGAYRARRAEDRLAAGLLGAETQWLGMRDAPFRTHVRRTFRGLLYTDYVEEERWILEAVRRLSALVGQLKPALLYAPLGVGNHVDHRVTFAAARRLGLPFSFYEDRPYCFVRHAVSWRCARLGNVAEFPRVAHWRSLTQSRYVRSFLGHGADRIACRAEAMRTTSNAVGSPRLVPQVYSTTNPRDVGRIVDAICAYRSQTPAFFGSRAATLRGMRGYARRLGTRAPQAERVWKFV